ncbi:MAG: type II toxin-antitoxin system Phd/YefM family antitoxin [Anaerolineae bacterium]|nr:type II toxin-antitoxin system Phd/YefM family antitoxin [Anaerolineae bacterium]
MTWTVQTTDLRRRARDILDRVRLKQEPVIIRSYDTPQAVLIPYEEFQDYVEWRAANEKRAAWLAELQRIAEEVSARAAFSEDEAASLVAEAIQATRGG